MGKPKQIHKTELVKAARKKLLNNGQGSVTLKNVAEAAGVTQGVIYYHFRTKQQLLLSIIDEYHGNMDFGEKQTVKSILSEEMYKAQTLSGELHLLIELVTMSLHDKELKHKLTQAMGKRIESYTQLAGGNTNHGRLLAALIDGLALQALSDPTFPEREMYNLAAKIMGEQHKKE